MTSNHALFLTLCPFIGTLIMLFWPKQITGRRIAALFILITQCLIASFILFKTAQNEILVTYLGNWKAPFGITIAIDLFSALMLTAVNLIFLSTTLFGFGEERAKNVHYLRLPLIFFLQTGVNLSLSTADFFNLFVAFEIMLSSSYALFALETSEERKKTIYTYIIVNIVGSFLFLANAAMIYGYTGNLNMAALSKQLSTMGQEPMVLAISLLTLIVYGIKSGIFPFYFWLPDSYPSVPNSLAALFSGTLTKVGLYALIRLFITILPHDLPYVYEILLTLSAFTMFLGVIGAISRSSIKGILCYHIISQIGYMVMAVAFLTAAALGAGIFFTIHNMIVKTSLILIGGIVVACTRTDKLKDISGFASSFPLVAIFFFLQAFSLAGLPPFSGFWGKFMLFFEGIHLKHYTLVVIAVITSFLTLFSMIKIWAGAFLGEKKGECRMPKRGMKRLILSTTLLVVVALYMALGSETVIGLSQKASTQLFNKQDYINAILGH